MNANELADLMDSRSVEGSQAREASALLRTIPLLQAEIEALETEIFVKDAIRKSYKEALEQIATGEIAGESTNYKDTVYVMRQIASDALELLRKAQET